MKKVKLLSLFSGIGAFEKALDKLGKEYELVNYCEIDNNVSKAYSLIHSVSEENNLKDVTKIDTSKLPNDIDILTYGFPCQDISLAGNLKGFEYQGKKTRSGLFFEALRIIEDKKPKVAIAENVKNLTSKRFKKEFEIVLSSLEEAGYKNYWKVLNAKDYGIPQNRERVFIVSIRNDLDTELFLFPKKIGMNKKLKDIIDHETNFESYRVNYDLLKNMIVNKNPLRIRNATELGYLECDLYDSINISYPNSKTRRGRVGKQCSQTLTTSKTMAVRTSKGIRYLTEKECFRLMGFEDGDFNKIKHMKRTHLYKMAGNSIVVNVLVNIFKELFKAVDFEGEKIIEKPLIGEKLTKEGYYQLYIL